MEAEPKITSVEKTQKTKDPKKVEAGKDWRPYREQQKSERRSKNKARQRSQMKAILSRRTYSVAVAVVLGGLLYTRYGFTESAVEPEPEPEEEPPKRPKRSLDSFD